MYIKNTTHAFCILIFRIFVCRFHEANGISCPYIKFIMYTVKPIATSAEYAAMNVMACVILARGFCFQLLNLINALEVIAANNETRKMYPNMDTRPIAVIGKFSCISTQIMLDVIGMKMNRVNQIKTSRGDFFSFASLVFCVIGTQF